MHDSSRGSVSRVLFWLFTAIALAFLQQPVRPPVRVVADSHRASPRMPAGLLPVLAQSLQRDADGYDITPIDDRVFEARNPAHALDARFTADGASVRSRTTGVALTLRVRGYGTIDTVSPVAPDAWVIADGRIERSMRHGTTTAITEWYVNSPLGLEQGFTLHGAPVPVAAPESDAPLVLDLDVDTTSDMSLADNGQTLAFDGAAGEPGLTFGHLDVWDAKGRRLPSRFAIDHRRLRIEVEASGAQYPITVDPLLRQAKLTASDAADGDSFGQSVAIDGDTAIVGAPSNTWGTIEQGGAAYIFVRTGTTWTEQKRLVTDPISFMGFGYRVAVHGDVAVISSFGLPSIARIEIWERTGTVWTRTLQLVSLGGSVEGLGHSLAVHGTTVLLGAPGANNRTGNVMVLRKINGSWIQPTFPVFTADDAAPDDSFGYDVALDGDTAVIGTSAPAEGKAYVFTRSGNTFVQQAKLVPIESESGDNFGYSVAIDGDSVLIGAYGAEDKGAAYVFTRSGTTWTQSARLTASDGGDGDNFGIDVAIEGRTALVSASMRGARQDDPGAAYLFKRNGTTWIEERILTANEGTDVDEFGSSIAISGSTLLIGAQRAPVSAGNQPGAAYVYANAPPAITPIDDQTTLEDTPFDVPFGVSDEDDDPSTLTLTVESSNPTLVPIGNLVLGGAGVARTLTVTPMPDRFGTATITITASDGVDIATETFTLTVDPVNDFPTMPELPNVRTNEDTPSGVVAFSVADAETPWADLVLSASSSNPALVPPENVVFGGIGGVRTLTIVPDDNTFGTATITVHLSDGLVATTESFDVTVDPVNDAPLIVPVTDPTTPEDTSTTFTVLVDDIDTPVTALYMTGQSSNPALLPTDNIIVQGEGPAMSVTLVPAADRTGDVVVTLTVGDGGAVTTSHAFTLHVTNVNDAPTIASVSQWVTNEDTATPPIPVTLDDIDSDVPLLTVSASSSNQALVPDGSITFGGSGANRSMTIVPAADRSGTSLITLTVSDGIASTTTSIALTVTALNDAPTIDAIADRTTSEDVASGPFAFTIGDAETAAESLTVLASSSNPALIPLDRITFGGTGATRTIAMTPALHQSGTATITVIVSDGAAVGERSFTVTVTPAVAPPSVPTYYLAEGATGPFFDLDLLLANPNPVPAPIVITFLTEDGARVVQDRTLPPSSRSTIRVDDVPGLGATSLSTIVTSPSGLPLIVERTMWWDSTAYGAHTEQASGGPASTWYFAEGAQGFFSTYLLIANPQDTPNTARVTYLREGAAPLVRTYPLAPASRFTIDAGGDPDLVGHSFGTHVVFDKPGVAERSMYFGDVPVWGGGHASAGVTAASTSWFLAEGATGTFFTTFLLLANPSDVEAPVTITYLPASGIPVTKAYVLPAQQRATINIATEDPSLADAAVATRVESTTPIVVERAQYWPNPAWYEGHNSFGVTAAGTHWGLAEGRVGGTNATQTYILLANPGAAPADVTITFLRATGAPLIRTFTVAPTSRFNVAITGAGSSVPELADEAFGAVIASTQPIAVERAMYANSAGVTWAAGTNATAARLP